LTLTFSCDKLNIYDLEGSEYVTRFKIETDIPGVSCTVENVQASYKSVSSEVRRQRVQNLSGDAIPRFILVLCSSLKEDFCNIWLE
jgi:hypothetical protein